MKWLLIITLAMACGKKAPPAQDLRDSDGDSVFNAYEAGDDKYVAEVSQFKEISGVLSFIDLTGNKTEISFSNRRDLKRDALDLLTTNKLVLREEERLSDWSTIHLTERVALTSIAEVQSVKLTFTDSADTPVEVLLSEDGKVQSVHPWAKSMSLTLTKDRLSSLLLGNTKISLSKGSEERKRYKKIIESTFRVFLYDEKSSKVFYISKEQSISGFLKRMEINQFVNTDEVDLLDTPLIGTGWWFRHLSGGDCVIGRFTTSELKENYLSHFKKEEMVMGRRNGRSYAVTIKKNPSARVFIVAKASKQVAGFEEYSDVIQKIRIQGSRTDRLICKLHYRAQRVPSEVEVSTEELLTSITSGQIEPLITHVQSVNGRVEMAIDTESENLTLEVPNLENGSYVSTGLIGTDCDPRYPNRPEPSPVSTNPEVSYSVNLDVYVEALN